MRPGRSFPTGHFLLIERELAGLCPKQSLAGFLIGTEFPCSPAEIPCSAE
jgi:hypothetical protein